MGQGPAPFLHANAQLDGPGTPCYRLTARVGRKRAALPRTEATTHQARMPPRCTIVIVPCSPCPTRSLTKQRIRRCSAAWKESLKERESMGVMQSSGAVDGLRGDRPQAKARRRGDGAAGPPPERRKPASRLMGMDVLATAHDPRIAPEPCDRASRAPARTRPAQPARFAAFAVPPLPPASPVLNCGDDYSWTSLSGF